MASEPKVAAEAKPPEPKMVSGTVARGHTVIVGNPGVAYGPGSRVQVQADEERQLIECGFLVDPGGETLEPGSGPQFAPNRAMITEERDGR